MKILKLVFWLLGLLVAVVVAASVALLAFFNPNDYKGELTALVKEKTGRQIDIEGNIKLSLFPWLGVTVGRMEIGNAPGFGPEPLARVDSAAVKVKILPLLRREVVMDTVSLRGLTLNLARDRSGRGNWQDLGSAGGGEAHRQPPGAAAAGRGLAALTVAGVDIRDARILWHDARDGTTAVVDGAELRSTKLVPGLPFDFTAGGHVKLSRPDVEGEVHLSSRATLSPRTERYRLDGLDLGAQLKGPALPGKRMDVRLRGNVGADLQDQTLDLSELQAQIWNLTLTGHAKGSQVLAAPRLQGTIQVAPFDPRQTLEALGQPVPVTADPATLKRGSATLSFEATTSGVAIAPLTARLDDTALQGEVRVRDLAHPATTFKLSVDAIDLDRYLPAPTADAARGAASRKTPAAPSLGAATLVPVNVLRNLDVQGALRVGHLKAANIELQDLRLQVEGRGGQVRVQPAEASLYQGHYRGDLGIDARQDVPRVTTDESLIGVRIEPLLKDLRGSGWLAGTADLNAKLSAAGNTEAALRRTVDGIIRFSVRDGAIKGVNIAEMIRGAKAQLDGKTLPPSAAPNQTDFAELSGTLQLGGGKARSRDLVLKSPLLRIAGAGEADLVSERVDCLLKTSVVATLEGQGGEDLRDLQGVTIPIRVHGSLYKPSFSLDLATLLKERAGAKLQQEKEKLQKKLEDKLKERLPGISDQIRQFFRP